MQSAIRRSLSQINNNHNLLYSKAIIPRRSFFEKPGYDAIVVGGGHNGLTAASYLSKEGFKVLVLEKRHVIGGAAVTEEIVPGFKFSRASYVLSLMPESIIKDLKLKQYDLTLLRRNPSSFTPTNDETGRYLMLGPNRQFNIQQISKFSERDAGLYPIYEDQLSDIVNYLQPLFESEPFDPIQRNRMNFIEKFQRRSQAISLLSRTVKLGANIPTLYELMTRPSNLILDRWFETDLLKATLATDAVIGSASGFSNGSGYVLLHHVMGQVDGAQGVWCYVKGGMGALSNSIAQSAQNFGADIRTDSPVKEILVKDGKAIGVELVNGEKITSKVVLSNATPHVTFRELVKEENLPIHFTESVKQIDYSSGVVKINLALNDLPNFKVSPNEISSDGVAKAGPQHQGTIHFVRSMNDIQNAHLDYVNGRWSNRPVIEMTIPSAVDSSLAPPGKHVCQLFVQYAPYHLPDNQSWDTPGVREAFCDQVFKVIEDYAPGFTNSVIGRDILSPVDIERIFSLTGGNIFHGAMSLSQLYFMRPVSGYSNYKTPVQNLYLCGAGAHPGGGVTGLPGRNAASAVLRELIRR